MSGTPHLAHDAYLASLGALPPQTLFTVTEEGKVTVLTVVHLRDLVPRLAVNDADLHNDLTRIVPEIMHWGRIAAIQKRVWTLREREMRVWKATFEMALRADSSGKSGGWGQGGRVNAEQVEASYRTASDYGPLSTALEAAEEAHLFADVVYRAFRSKQDVLLADVGRRRDGALQRLTP